MKTDYGVTGEYFFGRNGNLRRAIVAFVNNSPAGLEVLTEYRGKLLDEVNIPSLFPQKPLIEFHPEDTCCDSPLYVQKTRTRQKVTTMDIGTFVAKETVLECGQCQRTYPSQELKKLISPWCNFAYDVLVHVLFLINSERRCA